MIETIGYLAAIFTTLAFVPQALKVYRTNDTAAISLWMFVILNLGLILWLTYGIYIKATPIILANIVTFVFAFYILIVKVKNEKK